MTEAKGCRPRQFMKFLPVVLVTIGVLGLLNWVPNLIQKHRLQRFSSVEAARKVLNIQKIYLPIYIPENLNLAWPPSEVYAQDTPFRACIMHFTFRGKKELGLIIQQAEAEASYPLEPMIRMEPKGAGDTISVKNRKALLLTGVCDKETPCYRLTWNEGGTIISLTGKIPAREIIRIAGSMLPEK